MAASKKKSSRARSAPSRDPASILPPDLLARFDAAVRSHTRAPRGAGPVSESSADRRRAFRRVLERGVESLENTFFARRTAGTGHSSDQVWWGSDDALFEHAVELRAAEMAWVTYARVLRSQGHERSDDALAVARVLRATLAAVSQDDGLRLAKLGEMARGALSANAQHGRLQGILPGTIPQMDSFEPCVGGLLVDFFDVIAEPGTPTHAQMMFPIAVASLVQHLIDGETAAGLANHFVLSAQHGPYGLSELVRIEGVLDVADRAPACAAAFEKTIAGAANLTDAPARVIVETAIALMRAGLRALGLADERVRSITSLLQDRREGGVVDKLEMNARHHILRVRHPSQYAELMAMMESDEPAPHKS